MNIEEIQGLRIQGLSVRTCNADEAHPGRARIGALWADFAVKLAPHFADGAVTYGVYHHYESDANGAYDLLVGGDVLAPHANTDAQPWSVIDIQDGPYAVFQANGPMPQAVIEAWGRVWSYFADPQCPHKRAYTTDFERYGSDGVVNICIALAAI
jgi:predicted transcriptional regulator YdeE